jgi:hypothetical protein
MIAGGSAHGCWPSREADPVRVASQHCVCDPYRVELYCGERTGGVAPGYHMYPLAGIRLNSSL